MSKIILDAGEWFRIFKQEYRRIVEEKCPEKRDWFPLYRPTQFNVYLIEDEKEIFSDIEVFFHAIDEECEHLTDDVYVFREKVEWSKNFGSLEESERRMEIIKKEHELFYDETSLPSYTFSESFSKDILREGPKNRAQIAVQEDLIENVPLRLSDGHLETIRLRLRTLGKDNIERFLTDIKNLRNFKEEEKSCLISKAFWILGFEVLNLEKLKHLSDYKELGYMPHVETLAFFLPGRVIVAIEEGEISKETWYKKDTLDSTLNLLNLRRGDWSNYLLMVGKVSRGIVYLKDAPRCITYEQFFNAINDVVREKKWAPHLRALESILGESYKNIRRAFYWF